MPTHVIIALAETIGFVTASEYAYSKAPKDAKGVIQVSSAGGLSK